MFVDSKSEDETLSSLRTFSVDLGNIAPNTRCSINPNMSDAPNLEMVSDKISISPSSDEVARWICSMDSGITRNKVVAKIAPHATDGTDISARSFAACSFALSSTSRCIVERPKFRALLGGFCRLLQMVISNPKHGFKEMPPLTH